MFLNNIVNKIQFRRILSLAILIFSGTGFDILKIKGGLVIWFLLLLLLNIDNVNKIRIKDIIVIVTFIITITILYLLKKSQIPVFLYFVILSAYIVLLNYRTINSRKKFLSDISLLFEFYMYYTLIHILILLFGQSLLNTSYVNTFYRQFANIFWFIDSGGPAFVNNLRLTGLAWEPGIWQLFLNLNLLFILYKKKSFYIISLSIIAIVFTFSTTGILMLIFILFSYYFYLSPLKKISKFLFPIVIMAFLTTFISYNINDKLFGSGATSSAVRFGDTILGVKLLLRSPFIGDDPKMTYNSNDPLILKTREQLWNDTVSGDKVGYLNAEIINGFMIFLLDYGLIIGLYLIYKSFKFNLIEDTKLKTIFMLSIYITLFSEPISRTSFFYFFIISPFILGIHKVNIMNKEKIVTNMNLSKQNIRKNN